MANKTLFKSLIGLYYAAVPLDVPKVLDLLHINSWLFRVMPRLGRVHAACPKGC